MTRRTLLTIFLLLIVSPVHGQTPKTGDDYVRHGIARASKHNLDGAIADYDKALEIDLIFALPYANRSVVRADKHDFDGAIADYNKSIELDTHLPVASVARAVAREHKGDIDGAIADLNKAIKVDLRYAQAYNDLAWLSATHTQAAKRDGKKALAFARKAVELTKGQNPDWLDTHAAAYAETGNFKEAVKWEQKALSLPDFAKKKGDEARRRLKLYQERKPYQGQ